MRIASFSWNNALNGDVNLFALAAREFALHGQLDYPMKYEYSDQVAYRTLQTPASQHPPLLPILAGGIAKVIDSDDTFSILKFFSEGAGLLLIGAMALFREKPSTNPLLISNQPISSIQFVAVSLVSLSAVLIDFSANGSPYILMALWLTISSWLLLRFESQNFTHILFAGILCVLGILTHTALLLLPLCFLYVIFFIKTSTRRQFSKLKSPVMQILVFLLVIIIGLSPWFMWNIHQFGKVFYSYSSYYLFDRLGLLQTGIFNDVITSRLNISLSAVQIFQRYILLAGKSIYALCREFLWVVGPFGLILFVIGVYRGFKINKVKMMALLLPSTVYLAMIILWATYKFRFLTPLLPAFSLISAIGFMTLYTRGKDWRWLAGLCLAGTFAWFLLPFARDIKTLYYGQESRSHDILYSEMQPLASSLAIRQPGVVLGYSKYLDGGIETVYWHRLPFVAGRDLGEAEIKKLAIDYKIRYIWVDTTTLTSAQEWFPTARVIDQSGEFAILELPD